MVILGLGQAILGGIGSDNSPNKIYHFTCYQQDCKISSLNQLLEVPRGWFHVAIPILDSISGCISDSKLGYSHHLHHDKPKEND